MITGSLNKEKNIYFTQKQELYTATNTSQEAGFRSVFMN